MEDGCDRAMQHALRQILRRILGTQANLGSRKDGSIGLVSNPKTSVIYYANVKQQSQM